MFHLKITELRGHLSVTKCMQGSPTCSLVTEKSKEEKEKALNSEANERTKIIDYVMLACSESPNDSIIPK